MKSIITQPDIHYKQIDSLIPIDLIGKYKGKFRGRAIVIIRFEIDEFFIISDIKNNNVHKGKYSFKSFDCKNGG